MENTNYKNKFDFLSNFLSSKIHWDSIRDKALKDQFEELNFKSNRLIFLILCFLMFSLCFTLWILVLITLGNQASTYPVNLFISEYTILVAIFIIIFILGIFIKKPKWLTCFQITLIFLVFATFMTSVIYFLIVRNPKDEKNLLEAQTQVTRNMYYVINTICFFSTVFFTLSIVKLVFLNVIIFSIVGVVYYFNAGPNVQNEILFFFISCCYFELCGYIKDKNSKSFFLEKIQNELLTNYFIEIFTQMTSGLGIIRGEKFIFSNSIFDEFLHNCIGPNKDNLSVIEDLNHVLESLSKNDNRSIKLDVRSFERTNADRDIELYKNKTDNDKDIINGQNTYKHLTTTENKLDTLRKSTSTMINFTKLGILKSRIINSERTYEVFVSKHKLYNSDLMEIIINDITDSLEKEKIKEDFKIKSHLIAKISHEFRTPLTSIHGIVKSSMNIGEIENMKVCSLEKMDKHEVKKNCLKIRYLSKFLFVLIKELVYYINYDDEYARRSVVLTEVELLKMFKKCKNIINEVKNMNDLKSSSINFLVDVRSMKYLSVDIDHCRIFILSDKELLYHFIINIFNILLKIVYTGDIKVTIDLTRIENFSQMITNENQISDSNNKLVVEVKCKANQNIDELRNYLLDCNTLDYSKMQGVDISYTTCMRLSKDLGLNLEIVQALDDEIILRFDLECKYFIYDTKKIIASPKKSNSGEISIETVKIDKMNLMRTKKFIQRVWGPGVLQLVNQTNEVEICSSIHSEGSNRSSESSIIMIDKKPSNKTNLFPPKNKILAHPSKHKSSTNCEIKFINKLDENEGKRKFSSFYKANEIVKVSSSLSTMKGQQSYKMSTHPSLFKNVRETTVEILPQKFNKKNIIIIADDHSDLRKSFKQVVKMIYKDILDKIEIIECRDGTEILCQIFNIYVQNNSNLINCIITDEHMNFMNGSVAANFINGLVSDRKIKDIPIIFCTAYADMANYNKISSFKPLKILNKPLKKDQLLETFKEANILIKE
jgi:signal transduction histidine kinase/CheY-like chemotaxis protein